ncbi:ATP-binding protein [Hippea maritima]|uniref:ATP-binding protein n=1 Tax=Hippea maritima TaxID=84405 RepID=UPI001FE1249E|nr:transporter substrate-binding domain-containing protein [Hippea maritima]
MQNTFIIGYINKDIVKNILSKFAKILKVKPPENLSVYIKTTPKLELFTKKELDFIKNHPVIDYCIRHNLEPLEFTDKNGKPEGISIDLLKKISSITHLQFNLIRTQNFEQSLEFFRKGKCLLIPLIANKKLLKNQAIFSNPYAKEELFIFSKNNMGFVNSLCKLKNKIFLQVEHTYPILVIKQLCPQIAVKEMKSYNNVFKNLDKNPNCFSLASSLIATYYIKNKHLKNIKIVGSANRYIEISMVVNKQIPTLVSIINKSLSKIGKKGVEDIISYQLAKKTKEIYKRFILHIILLSLVSISVLFFIILKFYKKNQELSKIKRRLEESLKNFEIIMENSIQMVLLYKIDRNYLEVNETTLEALNYSKEELQNKNIQSLLPSSEEINKIKKYIENKSIFELNFVKKDNTILNTLAKATKIKIKNKEVILITAVDITPIKKLQEQLNELNKQLNIKVKEETEKNLKKDRMIMHQSKAAAVGDTMMMIAHQWRQPLNVISATVNNLLINIQTDRNIDEKIFTEKLNNILEHVKHLSETIDDFRNFFRLETVKEPTNIDELIRNLLRIINDHFASKNIEIKTELNCNCTIELYGNELKHVIFNILNNSRDALIDRNIKKPMIIIRTNIENKKVIIEIEDNGGGIDERIINYIFDAYFTTKGKKGTGLGLYISKIIIEEHLNGSIEVYNSKNGAVFKINLPAK